MTKNFLLRVMMPLALLALLLVAYQWERQGGPRAPLTVYCAHDSIYSEKILREFERRTGIPLSIRFDTEATKSLGLVELILHEKNAPRCDVFWNNEVLGTLRLRDAGLLQPHQGVRFARPAEFRDRDGYWVGFAARLRVCIVNTDRMPATADAVARALAAPRLDHVAIAKPLYGTTLTQYAVLWRQMGRDRLIAWHRDWRKRGVNEAAGNAMVKDLVAQGACDVGFTDTDDFFEARDDGKPVAMLPYRLPDTGETILIPNTVCILHGTRRLAEAQRLEAYLLSSEVEIALAAGKSRQIPLGPVPDDRLPLEVRELRAISASHVSLNDLGSAPDECLQWLKNEP